ncbi:hypothetical protein Y032_0004g1751 [Ancylostoma ceylanicum]|uniref:Uncharacterized protein n=1 Tax=Ancylostoma ceylanicum TaxID=53326 RepID=A0A016VTV6_9BILA|nr:hypothetical protein Y032_0004g1751 [Ancylostoma ceylanicum]
MAVTTSFAPTPKQLKKKNANSRKNTISSLYSVGTRKRLILFEHGSSVGYKRGGTLLVEVLEDQFCDVGKSGVRRYHEVFSNEVCLVGVVGVIRTEYVFFELRKSLMTSHFK